MEECCWIVWLRMHPSLITTRTYYLFDFVIIYWMHIREHLRLLNMVIDKSVMIIQLKTNHNKDSIHFTWVKWKYSQNTGQGEIDYYSDSRQINNTPSNAFFTQRPTNPMKIITFILRLVLQWARNTFCPQNYLNGTTAWLQRGNDNLKIL